MKTFLLLPFAYILFTLFIAGCASRPQVDRWHRQSIQNFIAYKRYYLSDKPALARNSMERAEAAAKQSADLETLASLYLGRCALQIALAERRECNEYARLDPLIDDERLRHYYFFITKKFQSLDPERLTKNYQKLASALKRNDYKLANEAVASIQTPESKLLALSLLGTHASKQNIEETLRIFSRYGYKKGVIFLLKRSEKLSKNPVEKAKIKEKLKILSQG